METPKLDRPGAGLPLIEKLVCRFYLAPFVSKRSDWDENVKMFSAFNQKILKMAEALTPEQLTTKVLVPPQKALEDSSRFWSIAMTMEHLAIVGEGVAKNVVLLSEGKVPDVTVDIAKVKPLGTATAEEAIARFRRLAEEAPRALAQVKNRKSPTTLYHPWFGPFTAHQWVWLLGGHSGIHYKQIKNIKLGISA